MGVGLHKCRGTCPSSNARLSSATRVVRVSPMRLEPLKSQSALIQLITDTVQGMSEERKALQDLGASPTKDEVMAGVQRATCLKMPRPKPRVHKAAEPHRKSQTKTFKLRLSVIVYLAGLAVALHFEAAPYVSAWKMHSRVAQSFNLS